jgi:hypothetical protein
MNTLIEIFVKKINTFTTSLPTGQEYRILIPAPTKDFAENLHQALQDSGQEINAILVIPEHEMPDKKTKKIKASNATSERLGSFIAIVTPGQLSKMHDSITSSGSPTRIDAISEEWPWKDDLDEIFRFARSILPDLIANWTSNSEEQEWLSEIILKGVLGSTKNTTRRGELVLDEILGKFNPMASIEGIDPDDIRKKFLFHCGVPFKEPYEDASTTIKAAEKLAREIRKTIQNVDARAILMNRVESHGVEYTDVELAVRKRAINTLLDHLGHTYPTMRNFMGLFYAWSEDPSKKADVWNVLDREYLEKIFQVVDDSEISLSIHDITGHVYPDGEINKKRPYIVGSLFSGNKELIVDLVWGLPASCFVNGGTPKIRIKDGTDVIFQQDIVEKEEIVRCPINLEDLGNKTKDIKINYQIVQDESILVEKIFDLVVHSSDRNNFVIIQSVDNYKRKLFSLEEPNTEGDFAHSSYSVDTAFHIHCFHDEFSKPSLIDIDEQVLELVPSNKDDHFHSKTKDVITPFDYPRSEVYLEVAADSAGRTFEIKSEKAGIGRFTFEEEFFDSLLKSKSKDNLRECGYKRFNQKSEPYIPGEVTPRTQSRRNWAEIMEKSVNGFYPIIVDLFASSNSEKPNKKDFYWSSVGEVNIQPQFESIKEAVGKYEESRNKVLKYLRSLLESESNYPLYATSLVFSKYQERVCEDLLLDYLNAYNEILDKISDVMHWGTRFFLLHLDTVVHYAEENTVEPTDSHPLFLLGPLHPLVLMKRFYVQRALYHRAERYISGSSEDDKYRHFIPLLNHTYALRWIPSVRTTGDHQLKHAYVCSTSDPGWHLAFKYPNEQFVNDANKNLYDHHGMYVVLSESTNDTSIATYIKDYLKSYPSKRAIAVNVDMGHEPTKIIQNIDGLIHTQSKNEKDKEAGRLLSGGVEVHVQDDYSQDHLQNVTWTSPSLEMYREATGESYGDILLLPSSNSASFEDVSHQPDPIGHARGVNYSIIFTAAVTFMTEGNQQNQWRLLENEEEPRLDDPSSPTLPEKFQQILFKINRLPGISGTKEVFKRIELPPELNSQWAIIPGLDIDPCVLANYVNMPNEERALWDYRVDIANCDRSYFVLTTIPPSLKSAIGKKFGEGQPEKFLKTLGALGLSIGAESQKTGKRAFGVIGQVAAARLFDNSSDQTPFKRKNTDKEVAIGFLLPVDSFITFFSDRGSDSQDTRGDLLATQLIYDREQKKLTIQAIGIECKYSSSTLSNTKAKAAYEQAYATTQHLRQIIKFARNENGMPERLALARLIGFGLRLHIKRDEQSSTAEELRAWTKAEQLILSAILAGRIRFDANCQRAMVVSTEGNLQPPSKLHREQWSKGSWVRLSEDDWPGIDESSGPLRDEIRPFVASTFSRSADIPTIQEQVIEESAADVNEETAEAPFVIGSRYTRRQIREVYCPDLDVESQIGGIWATGYAPQGDDLLAFLNLDTAGTVAGVGFNYDNQYDPNTGEITWYGKKNTNSAQPTMQKLINGEMTPHFFVRWDNSEPAFTYIGTPIGWSNYHDGAVVENDDETTSTAIKFTLRVGGSGPIIEPNIVPSTPQDPDESEEDAAIDVAQEEILEEGSVVEDVSDVAAEQDNQDTDRDDTETDASLDSSQDVIDSSGTQPQVLEPIDENSEAGFLIGTSLNTNQKVELNVFKGANKHILISGASGSGKTQTMKQLLLQLRGPETPILLFDFKNDFSSGPQGTEFKNTVGLTPINLSFDGLCFNPLIPPWKEHPDTLDKVIQPKQHISNFAGIIGSVRGLGMQQRRSVIKVIENLFREEDIEISPGGFLPYDPEQRFPDFSTVGADLEIEDPQAYGRLEELMGGGYFKPEHSNRSFSELLTRSHVINFSGIQSEYVQEALAKLIISTAHATLLTLPPSSVALKHIIAIDEATKILDYEEIDDFTRKCRSFGVGLIFASQLPTDFPAPVKNNMNTKIIHSCATNVEAQKDARRAVGVADGHPDQARLEQAIRDLKPLQAIIASDVIKPEPIRTYNYPVASIHLALQQSPTRSLPISGLKNLNAIDDACTENDLLSLCKHLQAMGLAVIDQETNELKLRQ